jgi:cardiolipin synthase
MKRTILTLPNLISFLRLLCVPLFLILLFGRDNRAAAAWLLGILGMTDWVDGYLARRLDQVSELGKALDPIADRLALIVGIGSILWLGAAPRWVSVLALVRELIVSIAVVSLSALRAGRLTVTWWGKAGTFALYFAFPFWLGGTSTLSYAPVLEVAAWFFAVPGLIASYYAAYLYAVAGRQALARARRGQGAAAPSA